MSSTMAQDNNFISGLAASLTPIRRRGGGVETSVLLAVCGLQFAGFAVLMRETPFSDSQALAPMASMAKVAVFGLGALLMSALALRSMRPGAHDSRTYAIGGAGILLALALVGLEWTAVQPGMAGKPTMAGQEGSFFAPRDGIRCLISSLTLALPMGLALTAMARSAAPLRPQLTGTLIGAASGFWGGFVYAAQCPYVSAAYVLAWYGAAIGIGTLIGRYALSRRLAW